MDQREIWTKCLLIARDLRQAFKCQSICFYTKWGQRIQNFLFSVHVSWKNCYREKHMPTSRQKKALPWKHGNDGNSIVRDTTIVRLKQSGAQSPGYRWLSTCYHNTSHYNRKKTTLYWLQKNSTYKILFPNWPLPHFVPNRCYTVPLREMYL